MFEPYLRSGGLFMLLFVPGMLLMPLLFALCVPQRHREAAQISAARRGLLALAAGTALLLLAWAAVLWAGAGAPWARRLASFGWMGFFPLWFVLAMPLLRHKHPAWGAGGPLDAARASPLRTAALGNRERQSPIPRRLWLLPALLFLLGFSAIAARGLAPFPLPADQGSEPRTAAWDPASPAPGVLEPSDRALSEPDAARQTLAEQERRRWLLTLWIYPLAIGISLLTVPTSIRRTLTEPEPLDGAGSAELRELYRRQRNRRALGLFWGGAVMLPAAMGPLLALPLWWPAQGATWGLVGGLVGTLLGLAGAAFGIHSSLERARIQTARARLERAG